MQTAADQPTPAHGIFPESPLAPAPDMLALRRALVRTQLRLHRGQDCLWFGAETMAVLAQEACERRWSNALDPTTPTNLSA